ncbi:MAG: aminoacyl-histidine dipeptidase [Oscillospiraceae bacterium]|nr:aminoacyl-histidine dipeptidase [Oscillospiraceae bacterium]
MAILTGLEPNRVFRYFEAICGIPHGSYHTKQISDYCVRFAEEHGLRYIQDEANNVILFHPGTPGYEQSSPVILQGHLDMVCEREPDCAIDFETDGLSLRLEDGYIFADGTTLGGDDGIAVAYALAILDSEDIPHPPLEVILTTDEEVGMLGAAALDCSPLRSRTMINLDSEDEGLLLVSCAGGLQADCHIPVVRTSVSGLAATVALTGLTGGHSGAEIDKGRANANQLMGRFLDALGKTVHFHLISVDGGLKDNAIPRETVARLVLSPGEKAAFSDAVSRWQAVFAAEYSAADPGLALRAEFGEMGTAAAMDSRSQRNVIAALVNMPVGIQKMSTDIPGLVQTSLNPGILTTGPEEVTLIFSVRSSVKTEKEALYSRLENLMALLGGSVTRHGDYPAWEYRRTSPLRELMVRVFEEQYGRKPQVQAIHAGLECGLFSGKLEGLDCVSIGPDMDDIHTTKERLNVDSVRRTWDYLLEVLKQLK